jgi:hypothetical protein
MRRFSICTSKRQRGGDRPAETPMEEAAGVNAEKLEVNAEKLES